jgi:predicted ester cyclase
MFLSAFLFTKNISFCMWVIYELTSNKIVNVMLKVKSKVLFFV